MEELLNNIKDINSPAARSVILLLFGGLVFDSSVYTVETDEVGIVQRFGKYRTTQPGLNFKLPAGIEKVTKVKVRRVYKEEFGFQSVRSDPRARFTPDADNATHH